MACERVILPNGGAAIACSPRRRKRCACGQPAGLLCDWKVGSGKTCDAPICRQCATSPAPDKDLCPTHARAFEDWKSRRRSELMAARGAGPRQASQRTFSKETTDAYD